MKAFVIIFIVISVIVAGTLLVIAIRDLIDEFKTEKAKKAEGPSKGPLKTQAPK